MDPPYVEGVGSTRARGVYTPEKRKCRLTEVSSFFHPPSPLTWQSNTGCEIRLQFFDGDSAPKKVTQSE